MRTALILLVLIPLGARAADPDPWLGPDKALHASVAGGLALGGYALSLAFTDDVGPRLAVGAGVSLGLGALKELIDLAGFGTPSWKDFAWDAVGCAVGLLTALLLDRLVLLPLAQAEAVR